MIDFTSPDVPRLSARGIARREAMLRSLHGAAAAKRRRRALARGALAALPAVAIFLALYAWRSGSPSPIPAPSPRVVHAPTPAPQSPTIHGSVTIAHVRTDPGISARAMSAPRANRVEVLTDEALASILASTGNAPGLVRIGKNVTVTGEAASIVVRPGSEERDDSPAGAMPPLRATPRA